MLEWWAALAYGADADAFLATQGDVWDTQWDMFLCLCGACVSLVLWPSLRPVRDRTWHSTGRHRNPKRLSTSDGCRQASITEALVGVAVSSCSVLGCAIALGIRRN